MNQPNEFQKQMVDSHANQAKLLSELLLGQSAQTDSIKKLNGAVLNVYMMLFSMGVIILFSGLLWFGKVDAKVFCVFVGVSMFPWYGKGIEGILRMLRGDRGPENKVVATLLGVILFAVIQLICL